MHILYIWDGRYALPENRRAAIEATLSLYPEARASCITRLKHFVSDQFEIIPWDDILFQMMNHFGFRSIPYKWMDPVTFSDWARFWYLGNNGDTLYLDTDCKMLKRYAFEKEFKAIYSPGNICLLYAPDGFKRENFLAMLEARARQHVGILMDFAGKFGSAWAKEIPSEYFQHRGLVNV